MGEIRGNDRSDRIDDPTKGESVGAAVRVFATRVRAGELQATCEQLLGRRLDKSSLRRRLVDRDLVKPVEGAMRGHSGRRSSIGGRSSRPQHSRTQRHRGDPLTEVAVVIATASLA